MQSSAIPVKIDKIWASSAPPGDITYPIPDTSQIGINPGRASWVDGFVPLNFTAQGAGGVPPFGQDFNGLGFSLSAWLQWVNAGGSVVPYDSTFSSSVGGYPKGAIVASATTLGQFYLSTAENNVSNPDSGGAGWASFLLGVAPGGYYVDTGAANAMVISPAIVPAAYSQGLSFRVNPSHVNTTALTINVGGLGAVAVTNPDGTALTGSEVVVGAVMELTYVGAGFQWINAPEFALAQIAAANQVWSAGGSANVLTISPTGQLTTRNGSSYYVKPGATNTAAATLNVNGAGAHPIVRSDGAALQAGDLVNTAVVRLTYDSGITSWRVAGMVASQVAGLGLKADGAGAVTLAIENLTSKPTPTGSDLVPIYDATGLAEKQVSLTNLATFIGSVALPAGVDANAYFYGIFL